MNSPRRNTKIEIRNSKLVKFELPSNFDFRFSRFDSD